MALINCPECNNAISDTNRRCPHCGYSLKKGTTSRVVLIIALALVVCLVAGVVSYALIIKPNQLLQQAENLITRGKYSEADVILTGVPESKKKATLVTQIVIHEAEEALNMGDYALAEKKIAMLPSQAIDAELLYAVNSQKATAILGQGRYIEADALYAELEQTEDIRLLREKLFYESRVLQCAALLQDNLIFPESLVLDEVLLKNSSTKDKAQSNETQEVYVAGEPTILLHYRAQSRGGSMVDSFVRFLWENNSYVMKPIVNTLTADKETPWNYEYMDFDEQMEYLEEQKEIAEINLALLFGGWFETYDLSRLNAVIKSGFANKVQMIDYNDIVPQPTPRINLLAPEPTSTPNTSSTQDSHNVTIEADGAKSTASAKACCPM